MANFADWQAEFKSGQAERAMQHLVRAAEANGLSVSDFLQAGLVFDTFWDQWKSRSITAPLEYFRAQIPEYVRSLKFARDEKTIRAAREAHAHKHGGEVCTRCGGAGGHSAWPGYVCFDCEGRGYVVR